MLARHHRPRAYGILNQDFDNSSIEADVGVTSDSITLFSRHLNGINARHPENVRKNNNDLTLRLLDSIDDNLLPTMAMDALKEIRAASADPRPAIPDVASQCET